MCRSRPQDTAEKGIQLAWYGLNCMLNMQTCVKPEKAQDCKKLRMVLVGKKELVCQRWIDNGMGGMLGCMQTETS